MIRLGKFDFCPNAWVRQRVDDSGPLLSRYPAYCGAYFPFVKGMLWGIDAGWATSALGSSDFGVPTFRLTEGKYTVIVRITAAYRTMLDVPMAEAQVSVPVTVVPAPPGFGEFGRAAARAAQSSSRPFAVPDVGDPDPATVPDLVALPPWG